MALDPAATFTARVTELGLAQHLPRFAQLKPTAWTTFAKLAFSTKYTPGGDEEVFEKMLTHGLGDKDHEHKAEMRRLFYEAYTLAADQLKRMLVNGSDDVPRSVPVPEKLARRKRAAQQLQGLELKGELDISDRLLERAIQIYDSNTLCYLGLDVCTKKSFDLTGGMRDKRWEHVPTASGTMEMRLKDDDVRITVDTQFAFSFAMQRRSLALLMGDVMAFELSEKLRTKYIAVLMKPPQEGYAQVGMQQVLSADLIFWTEMMECDALQEGTKRNANGRPCDQAFPEIFGGSEFRMALATRQIGTNRQGPVQRPSQPQMPTAQGPPGAPGLSKTQKRNLKRQANKIAAAPQSSPQAPGPAPNKAAKIALGAPMPKALIGMCKVSSTATGGQRFCYGFNLGSCKLATPGNPCKRGLHACMKPKHNGEACSAPHPCSACTL